MMFNRTQIKVVFSFATIYGHVSTFSPITMALLWCNACRLFYPYKIIRRTEIQSISDLIFFTELFFIFIVVVMEHRLKKSVLS